MVADPQLDPKFPADEARPSAALWRNNAFVRVFTAATVSIFGSLVTRVALPFVAITNLHADAVGVALVRSMELVAGLAIGLVAGAWVDRLRRRPVMIAADLGRAALLGLIPLAALTGWLSLPLLLLVTLLVALLTTFFDAADSAFLPTIVPRADLVRANGALAATASVSEFAAFGAAGFLVQLLTAPIAILIDAISFIFSALVLGTIRVTEPPPPLKAERAPVLHEIAIGLGLVRRNPLLRALTVVSMATAAMWGVFGGLWFLFAVQDLKLDAAAVGVVAAVGGISSLFGALLTTRLTRRFGAGHVLVVAVIVGMLGFFSIPLAPAGAPLIAMAFLVGQQLITDPAMTALDITDTSIRQSIVNDRQLGRVNATVRVMVLVAQLAATLAGGFLALQIGLRTMLFIGPMFGLIGILAVWFSPVRHIRRIEDLPPAV